MDSLGATSTASVPVSITYTSCSGSMSQVQTEATPELNYFCVVGASTCSAGCKSVLVRLTGLICYSTLVSEIGSSLSDAQKLCCDGSSVPCAASQANTGLSPGGKAGVAIAVIVVAALAAGAAGFVYYKKRHHLEASESQLEMKHTLE